VVTWSSTCGVLGHVATDVLDPSSKLVRTAAAFKQASLHGIANPETHTPRYTTTVRPRLKLGIVNVCRQQGAGEPRQGSCATLIRATARTRLTGANLIRNCLYWMNLGVDTCTCILIPPVAQQPGPLGVQSIAQASPAVWCCRCLEFRWYFRSGGFARSASWDFWLRSYNTSRALAGILAVGLPRNDGKGRRRWWRKSSVRPWGRGNTAAGTTISLLPTCTCAKAVKQLALAGYCQQAHVNLRSRQACSSHKPRLFHLLDLMDSHVFDKCS
jgi:hypothetical protein